MTVIHSASEKRASLFFDHIPLFIVFIPVFSGAKIITIDQEMREL